MFCVAAARLEEQGGGRGTETLPVSTNLQTLCHIITDKNQTNTLNTNIVCVLTGSEETHQTHQQFQTSSKCLKVCHWKTQISHLHLVEIAK